MDALRGLSILFVIEGHVRIFGMGIKSYDTMSALIIGAGSYHGLSIVKQIRKKYEQRI